MTEKYPIWWAVAAWPIDSFIEANEFAGKTVIPFCTSSSSGLGESGELLEELAGRYEVQLQYLKRRCCHLGRRFGIIKCNFNNLIVK